MSAAADVIAAVANPWRAYGLKSDPYFQDPLSYDPGSNHPMSLFVGRERELALVANQVVGGVSTRAIVQGPLGVGKTSFVNRLKLTLAGHGVLTHAEPVRVLSDMTSHGLAAEVLRVVLHIHAAQGEWASPRDGSEARFWRRLVRLLEGEDTVSGGVSAAGFGASMSQGRIQAERKDLALYNEVARAVGYLTAPRAPDGHTPRPVLLHVNNLDNLSHAEAARAAILFQDLRDYFLIPRTHWVFVGTSDIERSIVRATDAVGAIVPITVNLAPLAEDAVVAMLGLRYERLRLGVRAFTPPVTDAVARRLYRKYSGDLRNYLRVMSEGVQRRALP